MSDTPTPPAPSASFDTDTPSSGGRRIAPYVMAAVAVVLLGFGWVLVTADPPGTDDIGDSHLIGKPAPEVVTATLDGAPFDLSRRRGSWVVLNFFNTTCVPCINEHPELVQFAARQEALGAQGAELYTVVFDDRDGPVREFFDENGGDWPIITDPNGTIAVGFGMAKVPETWIIDPNGIVSARFAGATTAARLDEVLDELRGPVGG